MTTTSAADALDALQHRLQEHVQDVRGQLEQIQDDATYQARRLARDTRQAVREHPWRAIALAAAAGLLVGALAAHRRR